jgi:deoxyribodipyrimidine photolyase-related protein
VIVAEPIDKNRMESKRTIKTLRLILGDQLNSNHSWFSSVDPDVTYVLMELRSETDYVVHHVQKILGFFAAMRSFADLLRTDGHQVIYLKLDDPENLQKFTKNIQLLIEKYDFKLVEYQLPDEYRLDQELKGLTSVLSVPVKVYDSQHFFTERSTLADLFRDKKSYLMESFYRKMRAKHGVLMEGDQPLTGQWNYDHDNRKKIPKNHHVTPPLLFQNDVTEIYELLTKQELKTIGSCDPKAFIWPIDRQQSLQLLDFFVSECLPLFGTFEDAMTVQSWSVYHSR